MAGAAQGESSINGEACFKPDGLPRATVLDAASPAAG
jgi:hypothetical protein